MITFLGMLFLFIYLLRKSQTILTFKKITQKNSPALLIFQDTVPNIKVWEILDVVSGRYTFPKTQGKGVTLWQASGLTASTPRMGK